MYPTYGPPPRGGGDLHSLTLPRPPPRPQRLKHHKSFNSPPRRVAGGASVAPYGYGAPWRTKYEFYPPGATNELMMMQQHHHQQQVNMASAAAAVRRHHSSRRPHSPIVYEMSQTGRMVNLSSRPSFGHRYSNRPPPNVVFGRSRDDASIEKSSPSRDLMGTSFAATTSHREDADDRAFSFASAIRAEGTPTRMVKESLIKGSHDLYRGIKSDLTRSQSQLHSSRSSAVDIKKSKSFGAKEAAAKRSRGLPTETALNIHKLIVESDQKGNASAARVTSSSEREFECQGCGANNVVKKSKSKSVRSSRQQMQRTTTKSNSSSEEEAEVERSMMPGLENFEFRPTTSRARMLNGEEILKLVHFRRFFLGSGLERDDLIRNVSLIRARMREEERKAVDEYGMTTIKDKFTNSRR
jgi:hypothetical protein